jgi:putative peptidoglycan lipid II flippase
VYTPSSKKRQDVVHNSAIISLFSGLAIASSMVVDIVVAALFGVGQETDAFFVASTIPLLVYVVLKRACEVALVPVFVDQQAQQGRAQTETLFSILLNLALISFPLLALVGVLSSSVLVRIIGPGLDLDSLHIAQNLGQWMFLSMVLTGPLAIVIALLNARYAFSATASTDLVRNGSVLLVILLAHTPLGILSVAIGYLVGAIVQFGALLIILKRQQVRYSLSLDLDFPGVRGALRSVSWPIAGQLGSQGVGILERILASFLPPGSISALKYAQRITAALINILLNSISSASLPLLARQWSENRTKAFKRTLESSLKLILALGVPLGVALYVLRFLLVEIMFKRGMVTQEAVAQIAWLLGLYALGLPFLGTVRMLLSFHYSSHDTRTPAIHLFLMAAVNTILDVVLLQWLGAGGIALAFSVTGGISAVRSGWLVWRRIGRFLQSTWLFLLKLLIASAVMGGMLYLGRVALAQARFLPSTGLVLILELLVLAGIGVGTLLLAAHLLHIREILEALSRLIRSLLFRQAVVPPEGET